MRFSSSSPHHLCTLCNCLHVRRNNTPELILQTDNRQTSPSTPNTYLVPHSSQLRAKLHSPVHLRVLPLFTQSALARLLLIPPRPSSYCLLRLPPISGLVMSRVVGRDLLLSVPSSPPPSPDAMLGVGGRAKETELLLLLRRSWATRVFTVVILRWLRFRCGTGAGERDNQPRSLSSSLLCCDCG